MSIGHLLPQIHAKDLTPPKKLRTTPKVEKKRPSKYDHAQMLRDKINGMHWYDIGVKHGVAGKDWHDIAARAQNFATFSQAAAKLTPSEVEALHIHNDRKAVSK